MDERSAADLAAIAADTHSGASALLRRAIFVLRRVAADRNALIAVATELCGAQPSMAGFRTAAAIARNAADPAAALDRFDMQVARAPAAIARHASALLALRRTSGTMRLVTCSASQAVEATVRAVASEMDVIASCAEGRPQMEGRGLADRLASSGICAELFTDAAIGTALHGADALLVGADAVGPTSLINKVGTGALCILAERLGVPAYALAGREKMLAAAEFAALELRAGVGPEVWDGAPVAVQVRNPYFEAVPLQWIQGLITDGGVIYEY